MNDRSGVAVPVRSIRLGPNVVGTRDRTGVGSSATYAGYANRRRRRVAVAIRVSGVAGNDGGVSNLGTGGSTGAYFISELKTCLTWGQAGNGAC